ncbi:protein CyaE [Leminorella grimontii]|uniref:Protein CyaE n=1 Tax=Leminorella grimontii TaxID=82981 RepID=A0AAV5MY30_9GAMM|nr:TolC family protein [Leminorella grimontii]KFC96216.1 outer membrane efflux protein [Leminorella grimontii ATCC 33999 = DSM 5078]GKX54595.1 protein CyaE [Leminorella grimontii]GKX58013.1 protein CyaE [Leminorella grimontii]VFS58856.1 Outer membrane protein oprM precursor [Leminorella grimontii]
MRNWLLVSLIASSCLPLWCNAAPSQDVMSLIDELSSSKPAAGATGSSAYAQKGARPVITDDMLYRKGRAAESKTAAPQAAALSQENVERDICIDGTAQKGVLSFYDVVVLAMCNNPKAKATWLNLHYYQIEKDKSYAGYMPTVDGLSTFGHQETKTHYPQTTLDSTTENWKNTLELSWLLFDFGQREAGVDRAKSELSAMEFMTQSDLQDVVLDAAQKYFAVIAAQAYLDAARDIELIAYKSLQVTQGKREAGVGVLADELQAKNAALSSTNYRIQAEGDVRNAMGALASIIGLDITKNITFQKGLTVPSERSLADIQRLIDKALNQHPYLLSVKEQIAVSEKELAIAQRGFLPSVYLTSRWGDSEAKYGPTYNTDEFYMGVSVKVPIFSGFSQYNAVRSAQNKLERSKNQYAQSRRDIALQVWQTYQSLSTTQSNLKNMSDLVASSRRAYDIARGRYQSGVGSILELLNTQNDLSEAEMDNVNSMVEWHLSRLRLAASLGQLDVTAVKDSPLN